MQCGPFVRPPEKRYNDGVHPATAVRKRMRFLVMGAGAMGSAVGGFLAAGGHDVTLVGEEPHMTAIRTKGFASPAYGETITFERFRPKRRSRASIAGASIAS